MAEIATLPRRAGMNAPIRYMGTKRAMASLVRTEVLRLRPAGQVADLFSGMGTVAAALAPEIPVLVNDSLSFTSVIARARFLNRPIVPVAEIAKALFPSFHAAIAALREGHTESLEAERLALAAGQESVLRLIEGAEHVGNSSEARTAADRAHGQRGPEHYQLATLYFSNGYFSPSQAIGLDALRYAIDQQTRFDREWLLAGWLTAAGRLVNAPGHTAQFLRPRSESTFARLSRLWGRSPWAEFLHGLEAVELVGDRAWRSRNTVVTADAIEIVAAPAFDSVGLVYADPPYTKDHYSRFYHVYETLLRYDYPDSVGQGRYRSDRVASQFSLASNAPNAFEMLFRAVADRGLPLVLSYPESGLITRRVDIDALLARYFTVDRVIEVHLDHSTLGGSTGNNTKAARERVYVCRS